MFKGQPKGLFALALANTGERFGYYTMLAIFMLFLQAKFGWSQALGIWPWPFPPVPTPWASPSCWGPCS